MSYTVVKNTDEAVYIVDNDDGMSVTNSAEEVCTRLHNLYGDRRIIYRDTSGQWDELVHDKGVFKKFGFLNERVKL